jgi:hypothetical protein
MKLTTAALILFASTFGATAFVPRAPFLGTAKNVARTPLCMSEATTVQVTGETYE